MALKLLILVILLAKNISWNTTLLSSKCAKMWIKRILYFFYLSCQVCKTMYCYFSSFLKDDLEIFKKIASHIKLRILIFYWLIFYNPCFRERSHQEGHSNQTNRWSLWPRFWFCKNWLCQLTEAFHSSACCICWKIQPNSK